MNQPNPIDAVLYREIDKATLAGNHDTARLLHGLREEIAGIIEKQERPKEMPCTHEWYQGFCIHCEIKVADYRKSLRNDAQRTKKTK